MVPVLEKLRVPVAGVADRKTGLRGRGWIRRISRGSASSSYGRRVSQRRFLSRKARSTTGNVESCWAIDSLRKELLEDPRTQSLAQQANPLAESRPESIVRWRLHGAGFREWKPQIKVRGRGRFYFVDLGDPTLRVGVEYQGAHHFDREERAKDEQRANDLSWAGWVIIEATSKILSSESAWQELLGHVREEVDLARQQRNARLPRDGGAA